MTTALVLVHYDVDLPAETHPEASGYALGVIVIQRNEEHRERVVAYGSRRLIKAACNYTTNESSVWAGNESVRSTGTICWGG